MDHNGNVLVADYINHTIRRVTPEGVVTTVAGLAGMRGSEDGIGGTARFQFIRGIAVDGSGNMYVSDQNNLIRKVTPAGVVTTLAGMAGVYGSDDGTGTEASFSSPTYLAVDGAGNIWVPDYSNHTIRRITPDGVVTTVAGLAGTAGSVDGSGSEARFRNPAAIAIDAEGNLYVSDTYNHTIRKMTPDGVVTTFAGEAGLSGSTDGSGTAAHFNRPRGLSIGSDGTIRVADTANHTVRLITPEGLVSTLAGSAGQHGAVDGVGDAARFEGPEAVTVDGSGNVYVTDRYNDSIRRITPDGLVTTLAGRPAIRGDSDGSGESARFSYTRSVAVDGNGNVYVADSSNHTIRAISPAGEVSTFAGQSGVSGSDDGIGSAARFSAPNGVATDAAGNVYVADTGNNTVRRITAAGTVSTIAGTAGATGSADGTGGDARFSGPAAVTVDGDLNVYVADLRNHTIRKISAAGVVTTLAGLAGASGSTDGAAAEARFNRPSGVAVDGAGTVFVADSRNHLIRAISSGGEVSTVAGQAGIAGPFSDGTGSEATFNSPAGVAVDGSGNILVADKLNYAIRHITPPGVVTTVAGLGFRPGHVDGTGVAARFDDPSAVAVDSSGTIYVADSLNYAVRKLEAAPPDRAAVDETVGAVGTLRQLEVEPHGRDGLAVLGHHAGAGRAPVGHDQDGLHGVTDGDGVGVEAGVGPGRGGRQEQQGRGQGGQAQRSHRGSSWGDD
ncbi:MAG: hypothetical protein KY432_11735, partial [Acidobacteria bacterium]|nr:hypothetical protein [Acidobacteriota bacterium]